MIRKNKIMIVMLAMIIISTIVVSAKIDLTGTSSGGGNPFDQNLNTTDDVTFNSITGDGGNLTNISGIGSNPFDQDLNTTNAPSFINMYINSRIYRTGDPNTYMYMSTDQFDFYTGGYPMLRIDESSQDRVTVNPSLYDIDFKANGDDVGALIYTDASNDYCGFAGGFAYKIVYKTAAYTMTYADHVLLCNGSFIVTLPPTGIDGFEVIIKNYGIATIMIDGENDQRIDGQLTQALTHQYDSITLLADKGRSTWHIISRI